jgi:hypothetical protein
VADRNIHRHHASTRAQRRAHYFTLVNQRPP